MGGADTNDSKQLGGYPTAHLAYHKGKAMRFQVSPDKKAKQWIYDFDSVTTTQHFEELDRIFCESLLRASYQGQKLNLAKVKQANDKYNSVCVQLKRTDGLALKKDGFLEFLKNETPFGNMATGVENTRDCKNFVIEHVHKYRV